MLFSRVAPQVAICAVTHSFARKPMMGAGERRSSRARASGVTDLTQRMLQAQGMSDVPILDLPVDAKQGADLVQTHTEEPADIVQTHKYFEGQRVYPQTWQRDDEW